MVSPSPFTPPSTIPGADHQAPENAKEVDVSAVLQLDEVDPDDAVNAMVIPEIASLFVQRKRITAEQALQHEYLLALHNVNDEPSAEPFDFKFEADDVTENQLRGLIWEQLKRCGAAPPRMPLRGLALGFDA